MAWVDGLLRTAKLKRHHGRQREGSEHYWIGHWIGEIGTPIKVCGLELARVFTICGRRCRRRWRERYITEQIMAKAEKTSNWKWLISLFRAWNDLLRSYDARRGLRRWSLAALKGLSKSHSTLDMGKLSTHLDTNGYSKSWLDLVGCWRCFAFQGIIRVVQFTRWIITYNCCTRYSQTFTSFVLF